MDIKYVGYNNFKWIHLPVASSCEHGNELVKGEIFLD